MSSRFSSSAIFAAVLAIIGVVGWSGCGPGSETRYYCDSAGCYTCDAYGCSNVSPPPKAACTGNASCKPNEVCTQAGCALVCENDSACPQGEVCKNNVCAPPATDPGPKKECTTKADCGDGKTCVASTCQACGGSNGPCPCTKNEECGGGQACVAGACTATQNVCKYSSECGANKVCADGQCLTSCETAPCATGFKCEKGVCEVDPGATTCTTDAQCGGETPQCVAGACVKACGADQECGAGKYCDQGACLVDTRPTPNCTTDAQCSTGGPAQKCLGGFCKYTCTTDQYCRTIDNRIGYCAKDNVCRTQAEAQAACIAAAECDAGKSCIDNQCK